LGFVVAGAASVEVAILFDELEWVHCPVFALGFDNVGVREKEEGLLFTGTVIADDEIALFVDRAAESDVGVGKARGFEASSGGFGDGRGGAGGVAGADFDKFFVDVVSELLLGSGAGGLGVGCGGCSCGENTSCGEGNF
jgi:hypothetical protein